MSDCIELQMALSVYRTEKTLALVQLGSGIVSYVDGLTPREETMSISNTKSHNN